MPNTVIEVRRTYSRDDEIALIDAVHDALVDAFAIPADNRCLRLIVHEPHRFAAAPNLADPERYTLVTIDCFAGRSVQAKRNLYRGIVERLGALGIPGDHIAIVVRENTTENFGIRGGQAACDVDLGYPVTV
ncbi:tautomerase family protein [Mycolicibacillus parakoreensis]|uniref:Tautomerase family protein n=1 Tax=Mycolicibacillus parakoreensis TaxID=1069221 RepID=A0ABY3TXD1_9MYCO|nr:tautomerase family protein [Mycolicibacillus parakoreensis]MCV7315987.1 tautomerase family protein [Mycolicibacillus parakoreensis]ULN52383.1 tautomerase family protein [Mycolicibacillus parakoreensis]